MSSPTPRDASLTWRSSAPDGIESDLAAIWRELAQAGPVSRALMSNVIIVVEGSEDADIRALCERLPLAELARLHPARTIVVGYASGAKESAAPRTACVSVLTIGTGAERYGVELVAVHATCADHSIPSVVRALVIGDLPTAVWWASDLSRLRATGTTPAAIMRVARQFVFDSSGWADMTAGAQVMAALLSAVDRIDVADLNWRRLAALRYGIVHALQAERAVTKLSPDGIVVRARQGHESQAKLITAWLQTQLEHPGVPADAAAEGDAAGDLVVELSGPSWRVTASLDGARVEVTTASGLPPLVIAVPQETQEQALASELRELAHDDVLREVLRSLAAA